MNRQATVNLVQASEEKRNNLHVGDGRNQFVANNKKLEGLGSFSQSKTRNNVIKINKARLPADFFPKYFSFQKRVPSFKLNLKDQQNQQMPTNQRKVQSQRLHISPQKTSFFGFFDSDIPQMTDKSISSKKLPQKRKFQTRQQPKRKNSQTKRRFTPGSSSHRSDLLQIFPYDQHLTQIIMSNSSQANKLSPRKQYITRLQQTRLQVHDPEKERGQGQSKHALQSKHVLQSTYVQKTQAKGNQKQPQRVQVQGSLARNLINLKIIEKPQKRKLQYTNSQTVDLHNMTFFNVKSSCLPPIKKG